jgi:hypothetical protein
MRGRVLVVDDEKAMLFALKGLSPRRAIRSRPVESGEERSRRIETAASTSSSPTSA